MKQLLLLLFLCVGLTTSAQSELKFLKAFGDQNLETVSDLLSDNITLCVNDVVSNVSKEKAIVKLSNFIHNNKISRKKVLHNGKSTDKDSSYKVARIKTDTGTYRVFAYSEKEGNKSKIKEIRIDKM